MNSLAKHFHQVAYVVHDIEAAEAWHQKTLGIPIWTRLANIHFGEKCSYRGQPANYTAHLSLGYLGDTQIELIQPIRGDNPYTEFLDEKGAGLHHIAFLVPDFETCTTSLGNGGLPLLAEGSIGPGNRYAYFECQSAGASVIEIVDFDETTRSFMEQLKQNSAEATARA